ncbi:hypothetical protein QL285_091031 [Trifolium repens]|nr:hypothetical protein QL285_091031 [Trifolium repens]
MEMPAHRTWMYYKLIAGRRGYTVEFFQGVKEFLDFACQQPQYLNEGVIKCPCRLCKNERDLTPNEVNVHIRQQGFTPGYWYWTLHGEEVPQINLDVDMHSDSMPCNNNQQEMEFDDADLNDQNSVQNEEVSPNVEATEFYDTLNSTQQPLRSAYKNTSNMSTAAFTMLNLKSKHNMSQDCFNDLMKIMRESSHAKNKIPSNSRETKRTLEPKSPMVNETPSSSSNHVSEESNVNIFPILPEGDGFDQHKLVVKAIALIICTNLKEGKPSWKQLSKKQRDSWFDIFKSKFTWPHEHKDMVRRNFEKRGSAKMIQLMQEARKNLDQKPTWMEEYVWVELKAHWESSKYKRMSEINKRNAESMAGASLHTGGSIPHRLHWKRLKEAKGTDPSLEEFYFRTHRKKDQSWVGSCAESAYDKFEQRKLELSSKLVSVENGGDNQRSVEMPPDLDIWVDSVGKKKGRIFGLGSVSKTLATSVKLSANSEDVNALRSQIRTLNESLQKQEQEKLEMKQELSETRKQVVALMQHLGFAGSSSHPHLSHQHRNDSDGDHME